MDIKAYVAMRKEEMKNLISSMERKPHLVIVQVNDNPASDAYVRGKIKDGTEVGANFELKKLPPETSEAEVLDLIESINNDNDVDGLIVQLPLPEHISEEKVKLAVAPEKDVDGFHPLSPYAPCTPKGIINYLTNEGFQFSGSNAVVIGRSKIVGKPMAALLTARSANVTIVHSKTKPEDMKYYLGHADLVVVAVGRLGFLDGSIKLKEDAYVVDVGINRGEDGKLHGDCVPNLPVKLQTPVPGGVGLLTRLALLENLLEVVNK